MNKPTEDGWWVNMYSRPLPKMWSLKMSNNKEASSLRIFLSVLIHHRQQHSLLRVKRMLSLSQVYQWQPSTFSGIGRKGSVPSFKDH